MRKILSTIVLILTVVVGRSQVILNEVYTNPNTGKHQFFELYNTSTNPPPVQLGCYSLVVMYASGNGQLNNLTRGFYILDFPDNLEIAPASYFIGASGDPINVQGSTGVDAQLNWNDKQNLANNNGSLKKYELINGQLVDVTNHPTKGIPDNFNELFSSMPSAIGVEFAFFLFRNNTYVNGLIAGGGVTSGSVPSSITGLPNITVPHSCLANGLTINWNSLITAEYTNSSPGTDNGYARYNDGLCGSWNKTANDGDHTPGEPNELDGNAKPFLSTTETDVCGSQIQFQILSSTSTTAFPVEAQLYEDKGTTGSLDESDTYLKSISIQSGDNTTKIFDQIQSQKNYLLVYKTALGCLDKIASLSCTILPVHFKSFSAARNQQKKEQVLLKWETASEQNNRGFNVQRKVGGQWKNIAFVFSQADGGNSNTTLAYEHKEINTANTVSQYQIQQVDFDGKTSYSDIKSVLGLEQKSSVLIYPNPAVDGKVKLLFSELGNVKDVIVSDMNGRMVKQFRQLADTNLTIEGLQKGFYTIKIIDRTTATTTVEKVIIR